MKLDPCEREGKRVALRQLSAYKLQARTTRFVLIYRTLQVFMIIWLLFKVKDHCYSRLGDQFCDLQVYVDWHTQVLYDNQPNHNRII